MPWPRWRRSCGRRASAASGCSRNRTCTAGESATADGTSCSCGSACAQRRGLDRRCCRSGASGSHQQPVLQQLLLLGKAAGDAREGAGRLSRTDYRS